MTRFDRERGRDPGLYYLRVFGEPGGSAPWGWRFGGHHVSLNNLVVDGELVATTPCFMGADPAVSPLLGGAVNRPLGRVEDLARDLVRSLQPDLAARAVLLGQGAVGPRDGNRSRIAEGDRVIPLTGIWRDERFPDAVEQAKLQALSDADRRRGRRTPTADHAAVEYTATPKGVAGGGARRRATGDAAGAAGDLLRPGAGAVSPLRRYDDDAALDAVHIAWAGPTEPGAPHYYRVQGPRLLLEWDNTQRGRTTPLGVARPGGGLRPGRPRRAPRVSPLTTSQVQLLLASCTTRRCTASSPTRSASPPVVTTTAADRRSRTGQPVRLRCRPTDPFLWSDDARRRRRPSRGLLRRAVPARARPGGPRRRRARHPWWTDWTAAARAR